MMTLVVLRVYIDIHVVGKQKLLNFQGIKVMNIIHSLSTTSLPCPFTSAPQQRSAISNLSKSVTVS